MKLWINWECTRKIQDIYCKHRLCKDHQSIWTVHYSLLIGRLQICTYFCKIWRCKNIQNELICKNICKVEYLLRYLVDRQIFYLNFTYLFIFVKIWISISVCSLLTRRTRKRCIVKPFVVSVVYLRLLLNFSLSVYLQ